jgi:hypothetical protein
MGYILQLEALKEPCIADVLWNLIVIQLVASLTTVFELRRFRYPSNNAPIVRVLSQMNPVPPPPKALLRVLFPEQGRDSSVGIATRYGLDGPGIESRWGARFSVPFQTGPGAHPAPIQWVTGTLPGGKSAGPWRWPPTPSSDEVKERVELYLYSSSGPSWPVVNFTFTLPVPEQR